MSWHRKLPNQAACGSCCGIKEKLQTLWDRTINSILRINQVEPDDQGNIRIRSDNEALTVTEGTNEIVLNLDTSELPAASVVSVNGETGAVQLTGDDIPSLYNGTVNSNIYGLWQTMAQRSALNQEITNRQNADTALQNNINALQASIPQEAADAVAADPTVQSFAAAAAAIPDKVDKRTGAGLRAYTHTGSTQDDTVVEDSTNGATIPIRDANGRLHAADPAAGATDKTLTTANWVSQTGDSGPNNLIHKTGDETKNGTLTVRHSVANLSGKWIRILYPNPPAAWIEVLRLQAANTQRYFIEVNGAVNAGNSMGYGLLMILHDVNLNPLTNWIIHKQRPRSVIDSSKFAVVKNSDNTTSLYYNDTAWAGIDVRVTGDMVQSAVGQLTDVKIRSEITPNDVDDITTLSYSIPAVL